jgi:RNA polymerase sigma-70 factor, ECF subfamily
VSPESQQTTPPTRIPVSDARLVAAAQSGDADAFGVLVERYSPMVRRLTRSVLQQGEDADDAAQDAFLSAWTAIRRFDPRAELGPWLARIALNAARDLRRRRRVRATEALPETAASSAPTPDAASDRALLRERLGRALAELPERQRLAIVLFEVEGYAHAEIAALLGIPEGTARSDVFHARRRLRAELGQGEGEG